MLRQLSACHRQNKSHCSVSAQCCRRLQLRLSEESSLGGTDALDYNMTIFEAREEIDPSVGISGFWQVAGKPEGAILAMKMKRLKDAPSYLGEEANLHFLKRDQDFIEFPWVLTQNLSFLDDPADTDFKGLLEFGGWLYYGRCPRCSDLLSRSSKSQEKTLPVIRGMPSVKLGFEEDAEARDLAALFECLSGKMIFFFFSFQCINCHQVSS